MMLTVMVVMKKTLEKARILLARNTTCFRVDKETVLLIDELLLSTTCQQPKTTQTLVKKHGDCIQELKNYILQLVLLT